MSLSVLWKGATALLGSRRLVPQPDPAVPLHNPGETLLPAPDTSPEVPPDMTPIFLQWQKLTSIGRESPDFLPLLSSLTAEVNRSSTVKLCGDDARIALSVTDEVSSACAAKAIA